MVVNPLIQNVCSVSITNKSFFFSDWTNQQVPELKWTNQAHVFQIVFSENSYFLLFILLLEIRNLTIVIYIIVIYFGKNLHK